MQRIWVDLCILLQKSVYTLELSMLWLVEPFCGCCVIIFLLLCYSVTAIVPLPLTSPSDEVTLISVGVGLTIVAVGGIVGLTLFFRYVTLVETLLAIETV